MSQALTEPTTEKWKYPHVVEAARSYQIGEESSSWRLADALLEDVPLDRRGRRPAVGVRSGLQARLEEAAREMHQAGVWAISL